MTLMYLVLTLHIFHITVRVNAVSKENSVGCGFVQELSRATLTASNKIFVFSGKHFYLVDLKAEELQGTYSMEQYYKGVPTDMEAATLHNPQGKTPAMLFIKSTSIYMYLYARSAFETTDSVLDNMGHRENLSVIEALVSEMKNSLHEAQAYNAWAHTENKKLSMCMEGSLFNCGAILKDTNPIANCTLNEVFDKTIAETCKGLTFADFEDNQYLVFANDKSLLLFLTNDNGDIDPKPHKSISLSKIFKCPSRLMSAVIALAIGILVLVILNVAATVVWLTIRKRQRNSQIESDTVVSDASTVVEIRAEK